MVRVFKTDVLCTEKVQVIVNDLLQTIPDLRVTFDLEDEDKIMRVEGKFFKAEDVIFCLKEKGHCCIYLPFDLCLND
ncbi:hypothetical protein [Chitinophaga sp. S165]|uniref:hypothetical protein n=1 Tax=Chitinophaga sp. S165 TaxID=2135462 RepID=UPI000D70B442|nr:hypothetical protein [Chitinophaga sp. S165]PWV55887.1 hypothetical protein C7475_101397 [Chitinophaga sp. S165]